MSDIKETLKERQKRYGNYLKQATISESFKFIMGEQTVYWRLLPDQKDALDMIAVKVARILNGDPDYIDNWLDIAGYATLVSERLKTDNFRSIEEIIS